LTVTAAGTTKVFGAPLPAFSATFSGFVNGNSPANLAGTLSFATAAIATSPVGSYQVTPGGLSSANYAIAFASGTLAITPASTVLNLSTSASPGVLGLPVTFTATPAAVPPGAGTPSGTVTFLDGASVLGVVALANGSARLTTSTLGSGGHTIAAHYAGDTNFTGSDKSLTESIGPATLQLSASVKILRNGAGQYVAAITIKSSGTVTLSNAQLVALLNNTPSLDAAATLGNLPFGGTVTVFQTFPASAGVAGSANNVLRVQITSLTGNATISLRVALP
jgi:hypothetical protein